MREESGGVEGQWSYGVAVTIGGEVKGAGGGVVIRLLVERKRSGEVEL